MTRRTPVTERRPKPDGFHGGFESGDAGPGSQQDAHGVDHARHHHRRRGGHLHGGHWRGCFEPGSRTDPQPWRQYCLHFGGKRHSGRRSYGEPGDQDPHRGRRGSHSSASPPGQQALTGRRLPGAGSLQEPELVHPRARGGAGLHGHTPMAGVGGEPLRPARSGRGLERLLDRQNRGREYFRR